MYWKGVSNLKKNNLGIKGSFEWAELVRMVT